MWTLLSLPSVALNEVLDILMSFIPRRVWNWIWRDATTTETARAVDVSLRVVLSVGLILGGVLLVALFM
jgi:hypothetical protein